MKRYKAVMFAPDGEWVVDFPNDSKDEVIGELADRGSRWYFYPFDAVILNKGRVTSETQRLIDVSPDLPQEFVGKSIKTLSSWLCKTSKMGYPKEEQM